MFRFTIRDVLWLTVVVAMGVGWWVERARNEQAYLDGAADESGQWRREFREHRERHFQTVSPLP